MTQREAPPPTGSDDEDSATSIDHRFDRADVLFQGSNGSTAWQTIERRAEAAWLRRELTDWDDWEEYEHVH